MNRAGIALFVLLLLQLGIITALYRDEMGSEGDFRAQLALRGMGNLQELKMGSRGMRLRVDNAAGHLLTVGMAQALFEIAFDIDSKVEWELSMEGNLEVEIRPQVVMETV